MFQQLTNLREVGGCHPTGAFCPGRRAHACVASRATPLVQPPPQSFDLRAATHAFTTQLVAARYPQLQDLADSGQAPFSALGDCRAVLKPVSSQPDSGEQVPWWLWRAL